MLTTDAINVEWQILYRLASYNIAMLFKLLVLAYGKCDKAHHTVEPYPVLQRK